MSNDGELGRARWLFFGLCAFLISGYAAFGELCYLIWGQTTEARVGVVRTTKISRRRGRSVPRLVVEYSFTDGQQQRSEQDILPIDWPRPQDATVPVQYIAGEPGSSRLAGHRETLLVLVFVICLLVVVGFIFKLVKEANEPIRGPRRLNRSG